MVQKTESPWHFCCRSNQMLQLLQINPACRAVFISAPTRSIVFLLNQTENKKLSLNLSNRLPLLLPIIVLRKREVKITTKHRIFIPALNTNFSELLINNSRKKCNSQTDHDIVNISGPFSPIAMVCSK